MNHAHQYYDLAGVLPMTHGESVSLEGASKSLLSRIVEHEIHQRARNEVNVFDRVRVLNRSRELKEQERLDNQKMKHDKQTAKVAAIQSEPSKPRMTTNELTTMVSWYKRPGESKIPSTRAKLVARYLLTCNSIEDEIIEKNQERSPLLMMLI